MNATNDVPMPAGAEKVYDWHDVQSVGQAVPVSPWARPIGV